MYKGKSILALIPARGGSKGIINKNIVNLNGKPLIQYSIDEAINSKRFDAIIVSTDSEVIAEVAQKCGAEVPFLRPHELATDESKTIDTVLHAIDFLKNNNRIYDMVVLLQPTQPLRTVEDIRNAIDVFLEHNMESVVSVSLANENPLLIRTINKNGQLKAIVNRNSTVRRQDLPKYYKVNGAIYINKTEDITKQTSLNDNKYAYIMPQNQFIDIDTIYDLELVQKILEANDSYINVEE